MTISLDAVVRLGRDLVKSMSTLTNQEARYLVDAYYAIQENRKRAGNQERAAGEASEPHAVFDWMTSNYEVLESQIKRALDAWTDHDEVGAWAKSVYGIGPVISAGLLAHIDIAKAPTVGHIWRFAGLDPTINWQKGQKRPFNARLKVVCWNAGQCFMKFSNRPECFYGHIYRSRKADEMARNARGEYAAQAAAMLVKKKIGQSTDAFKHYSDGRLPPAHIDARARRYAVKLFLSHWHEIAWRAAHGGDAPAAPYPIAILGHAHYIAPEEQAA